VPPAGGTAAKLGLRYELLWTVGVLAEILGGRSQLIRLEPPLLEGEGVEFWLEQDGARQYHQAKRQTTRGSWSLASLASEGVLRAAWTQLQDGTATFVFVSRDSAEELADLIERARAAIDLAEFRREFAADQRTPRSFARAHAAFSAAAAPAPVAEDETLAVLKRISVRTLDEESLAVMVANRLEMFIQGEPVVVAALLKDVALKRVNERLDAVSLWMELRSAGFDRRGWVGDTSTLALVEQVNAEYLSELRTETLLEPIERPERDEILNQLAFGTRKNVLAVGGAGVGKSGVLLQLADVLARDGLPFLAFRMDRRSPTGSPTKLGEELGFAGSPVNVLAAVANERASVLLIDQLDAVSSASGRAPEFFTCVEQLLAQAREHQNMRVLLACRRVDAENDPRLRALTAGEDSPANLMEIRRLDDGVIRDAVNRIGLDSADLTPQQMELLSLPLNLTLLAQTAVSHEGTALDFDTAANLYERWWDFKEDQLNRELGRQVAFVPVLNTLVDYMSDSQQLSAPQPIVDPWRQDARAMAAANVIVEAGPRYAFVHEGFFDFVFARQFVARGSSLAQLLQGEQHLFRRAQVRQVLQYLRDLDAGYIDSVKDVLLGEHVRLHLKEAGFAFLATVSTPTRAEWDVVAEAMRSGTDAERRLAWRPVRAGPWFGVLDEAGLVAQWLSGNDEEARYEAVLLLGEAQREHPDRVAELLAPYVDRPDWGAAFLLVARASVGNSRALLDLYLRLLEGGHLDSHGTDVWYLLKTIEERNPEWGVEALTAFLHSSITRNSEAEVEPFANIDDRGAYSYEIVTGLARDAPQIFANKIVPLILEVASIYARREGEPPFRDSVWGIGGNGATDVDDALIEGASEALRNLASGDDETLPPLIAELRESALEVAYRLLFRTYAAAPKRYADDALAMLVDMPTLLDLRSGGNGHEVISELLQAASPYASDATHAAFEELLVAYYPDWERRPNAREYFGSTQYRLLRLLAAERLSETARAQLTMLEHKYPTEADGFERSPRISAIASPISGEAAQRMTDQQWMSAMQRYLGEALHVRRNEIVGGIHEVAHALQGQAAADPARFVALAERMDDELPYGYFSAIASGVIEVDPDLATIEPLVERLHRLPNRPAGSDIARLVRHAASEPIGGETIELMLRYAAPRLSSGERAAPAEVGSTSMAREPVAHAIAALLFYNFERKDRLVAALIEMAGDENPVVRAAVAEPLAYLLGADREQAIRIFLALAEDADGSFFRDPRVDSFLGYALQTSASDLRPVVVRMMEASDDNVVQLGAQAAMFARRFGDSTHDLADQALTGRDPERLGAITVLANQLHWWPDGEYATSALATTFGDSNHEVRKAAAQCFSRLKQGDLNRFRDLIARFIESDAFATDPGYLIYALKDTTERLPEISLNVCERFLARFGPEAADIRTARAGDGISLAAIVFRVYSQTMHANEQIATRCLDLIDGMIAAGLYGVDNSLRLFER
jgi:hypothetical protein